MSNVGGKRPTKCIESLNIWDPVRVSFACAPIRPNGPHFIPRGCGICRSRGLKADTTQVRFERGDWKGHQVFTAVYNCCLNFPELLRCSHPRRSGKEKFQGRPKLERSAIEEFRRKM